MEGIEKHFLESWEGWDQLGATDLYFYNVVLKTEVFGEDFVEALQGKVVDLLLRGSTSQVIVEVEGEEVVTRNFVIKLCPTED